tara:strand:- start:236 stop:523 length:288 start_codon:yes stop_codon:yes gene_type:complete
MARVTIEDCLLYLPNRFKIVVHAAKRARELSSGAKTVVDGSKVPSKCTVAALKEIAAGHVVVDEQKTEEEAMDILFNELNKLEEDGDDLFDDSVV